VKRNGWAIYVSNFIAKTISRIKLSNKQITDWLKWLEEHYLSIFEARKIIYPEKGFDIWWDLSQLIKEVKITINIFNYTHLDCIAVFAFDCSSAYEGFSKDALNINNININPEGRQRKLCNMVIPLSNLYPTPSKEDTYSQVQQITFSNNHSDKHLLG
jgi:hypothetical protein